MKFINMNYRILAPIHILILFVIFLCSPLPCFGESAERNVPPPLIPPLILLSNSPAPPVAGMSPLADLILGADSAPITIIMYFSFTCPHCGDFHRTVLPEVQKRYIDTGQIRFIIRNYPDDQLSLQVAMLSRCGRDSAQSFKITEDLLLKQSEWFHAREMGGPVMGASKVAMANGLSEPEIRACLGSMTLAQQLMQVVVEGYEKYRIRATPAFIINGALYPGIMKLEDFENLVKETKSPASKTAATNINEPNNINPSSVNNYRGNPPTNNSLATPPKGAASIDVSRTTRAPTPPNSR